MARQLRRCDFQGRRTCLTVVHVPTQPGAGLPIRGIRVVVRDQDWFATRRQACASSGSDATSLTFGYESGGWFRELLASVEQLGAVLFLHVHVVQVRV